MLHVYVISPDFLFTSRFLARYTRVLCFGSVLLNDSRNQDWLRVALNRISAWPKLLLIEQISSIEFGGTLIVQNAFDVHV